MNRISLVIKREYLTRIKKKSFIIMTILTPILFAMFYGAIFLVFSSQMKETKEQTYLVYDATGKLENNIQGNEYIKFSFSHEKVSDVKKELEGHDFIGYIEIPPDIYTAGGSSRIEMVTEGSPSLSDINFIENAIEEKLFSDKLSTLKVTREEIEKARTRISISTSRPEENGAKQKTSTEAATIVGLVCAVIIYMFIFLYGIQVMRGVIEEKTNRIVEVIISSVKPFELMMGKIIGIAMVGLTQLFLWVIITIGIVSVIGVAFGTQMDPSAMQTMNTMNSQQIPSAGMDILSGFAALPFLKIFTCFVIFFIGGYMFYSSLFAAIGSAVDQETDTQQFMFPVTIPLVFGLIIAEAVVTKDPNNSLAFWASIIPFTSPVVMMVRLPFMTPADTWQILLSIVCLFGGFIFTTWMAGRIYRTGILMYGKKPTWKEIGKWLFYKN